MQNERFIIEVMSWYLESGDVNGDANDIYNSIFDGFLP